MAAREEERAVRARTVKAGNIKPPWEVREIPEPPPISPKGLFQWAGPAVILGALAVGGFEAYHAGYMGAKMFLGIFWLYLANIGLALFTVKMSSPGAALEAAKVWLSFGYFPAGITLAMIGPFLVPPTGGFWNFLAVNLIWTFKDRPI